MNSFPEIELDVQIEEKQVSSAVHDLIVYNDDVNTFDFVIDVLIEVCSHTPEQAEQCTLMIHYKGKCCVKHGDWDKLVAMRNAICERGLSAEVE
jgi:ATP-dependent Clp protease adaptor protein ClpS